ncbi:MAG TPA: insulinase family protein [Gemmatimonadaceae bacterium]|nr:insulinase family protein [Gemmatimonadaceae bacterium]
MMRVLALAFVAATSASLSAQQPTTLDLSARLPVDPKIRAGTLPNGIRYYIKKNLKPEKRAELRLAVNAGSILETDNQLGLAHFVEHTAFNGTKHFAKNDLVKYLQSIGVRFGADLNAYTSFDETVYILPIPTDTARIVEQAFTILEDWAHGQVFDSAEVTNERGVVHEEWRLHKGAGDRMLSQYLPIALKGSLYAKRLPIGTEQSIMTATPARLRPFYRDWYRPDLMAVVAVGDFDVDAIEAQIRKHFAGIPKNPNAPKRRIAPVPPNDKPLIAIASDKEATSTTVSLYFKLSRDSGSTVGDYRRQLMEQLYLSVLNDRLSEIAQKPNAPFIGAGASRGSFVGRELEPFSLGAAVKDGEVERGLEALLVEARRVDQFGVLQSELDRAKADMLRAYERANAERDKTPSDSYADEYLRNFLEGEAIPGIEYEYSITEKLLPTISLAEVNRLAARWITDSNRVVIVEAPIKAGVALPTEATILAAFARAAQQPVVAYTEKVSGEALVADMRPAGRVASGRVISAGVTEWKLSNGARVLIKPTDFKADEILFSAYSPGGHSLVPNENYMSAAFASQIMGLSGLGSFSRVELDKKLAGKAARVSPSISEMTEGLSGSASPKDLETLFQLIYLDFTGARLDTSAWAAFRGNAANFLANRGASPEAVFSDTVQVTMGQHAFRARPLTQATFDEIVPEKSLALYRERFAEAGDFTFVFVGNVDTTALKPLVERYLASLPAAGRKDSTKVNSPGAPKGVVQTTVHKGVENKATTLMAFTGPCVFSPETRFAFRALMAAFQLRLTESLREKLGGTYSPSVSGGCNRTPRQDYAIQVYFGSSPDNVDVLTKSVFALIDTIKTQGPTAADVEKVREQIIREHEVELKQNNYWLSVIVARDQAGEDIAGVMGPYEAMARNVTAAQIQDAAKKYFDTSNYARFVLLPEASRPASP